MVARGVVFLCLEAATCLPSPLLGDTRDLGWWLELACEGAVGVTLRQDASTSSLRLQLSITSCKHTVLSLGSRYRDARMRAKHTHLHSVS